MSDVIAILRSVGAIAEGHFVGTHGPHFTPYINKDALALHPKEMSEVGRLFAEKFKDFDIDVVVAPAVGAVILGHWCAYYLSELKGKEVLSAFVEKGEDKIRKL